MTAAAYPDQARKKLDTLRARAAYFCGIAVECVEDDRGQQVFIATKGPLLRHFASLEELSAWLDSAPEEPAVTSRQGAR